MKINNRQNIFLLFFLMAAGLFFASSAAAVCPVCTIAVGACLGLSRYLGIDDAVTSLWIGGLLISMIAWMINWLDKKNIKFIGRKISVAILFYVITLWPLYWKGMIGHPLNKFWGVDKIILGVIIGSLAFLAAIFLNNFLKKRNDGQVYFPFQKVAVPLAFLGALSFIFYFLTC